MRAPIFQTPPLSKAKSIGNDPNGLMGTVRILVYGTIEASGLPKGIRVNYRLLGTAFFRLLSKNPTPYLRIHYLAAIAALPSVAPVNTVLTLCIY
jgi:hypothetical protein